MSADVFLLLGYPGTGKLTVARALAAELASRGRVAKVVDNHHMNNPIFEVVLADGITPLPQRVWELVEQVRDAVLTAIEELGPSDCTYIFTNFIRGVELTEPNVVAYLSRLDRLATSRGGLLRQILLTCSVDELCRRVAEPSRRERHKSWDTDWVRQLTAEDPLYKPEGPHATRLDITNLAPVDAAKLIDGWRGNLE